MYAAEVIARLKTTEPKLRAFGVSGLYLFGSYSRDEVQPDSDVDAFIDKAAAAAFGLDAFIGPFQLIQPSSSPSG
ncbi:nucleotidyltransferase domain-containing protein [Bradyrhizobium sp. CCGUVB1N3]|uniref:nucleotidyltransferase family protein n=1 Tax=Bradyrhizobium sp. CCGUVB1N3 TaxID=2949629 RepID=UPI0020B4504A|nr:nucleotidyltransferase domain-containing protein [Bradyrhizobium sp. CCGUVB1N3]MCP3472405.1 nucleotidyltransferase domain-containing protein [Bradyrhizobium sp. CCGUVB1N3]